jgi:DNA-binding LacI/PurR family transcriptional regulator
VSTVSRALSDSPLIPKPKREEIQTIARQAGYVINQAAQSLRLRKTQTIAVLFPLGHDINQLVSDPFFIEMFSRLADEITSRGYKVLLIRVTDTHDGWLNQIIQSQSQDGIIVVGQSDQHQALTEAARSYDPFVVWGSQVHDLQAQDGTYCTVGTDNVEGGMLAVNHLLANGRKHIAFLGNTGLPEIAPRFEGYHKALLQAGLNMDPRLVMSVDFTAESARQATMALLQTGIPFDGIFAVSDVIALSAIQALQAHGLRVPQDVGVVGFDDTFLAERSVPALTTIRQDLAGAASAIVERLFQQIAGERPASMTLAPKLIVRQSCGTLPV